MDFDCKVESSKDILTAYRLISGHLA